MLTLSCAVTATKMSTTTKYFSFIVLWSTFSQFLLVSLDSPAVNFGNLGNFWPDAFPAV